MVFNIEKVAKKGMQNPDYENILIFF